MKREKGGRIFRNNYKGHIKKPRGVDSGEGGGDKVGLGGVVEGGEGRKLYLNNN